MIYESNVKEVRFDLYCEKCKHSKLDENDEPCNECLGEPIRQYSHKPLRFEESIESRFKR